jgi:hypothetical protein
MRVSYDVKLQYRMPDCTQNYNVAAVFRTTYSKSYEVPHSSSWVVAFGHTDVVTLIDARLKFCFLNAPKKNDHNHWLSMQFEVDFLKIVCSLFLQRR